MASNRRSRRLQLPRQILEEMNNVYSQSSVRQGLPLAAKRKESRKSSRTRKGFAQKSQTASPPIILPKQILRLQGSDDSVQAEESAEEMRTTANRESSARTKLPSTDLESNENEYGDTESHYSSKSVQKSRISRAARERLAEDDAKIAALERKLGTKGKQASIGSLLEELGDLGGSSEPDEDHSFTGSKRKRDTGFEDWLRSKRQVPATVNSIDGQDHDRDNSGLMGSFEPLQSGEGIDAAHAEKENPYLPPSVTKTLEYTPVSLGQLPNDLVITQEQRVLQRKIQGLLNKLSESNLAEIVKATEGLYRSNPRNDVSTALVDLLLGVLADESSLNDNFIILHAGYVAALYRVVGVDFTAKFLQTLVERSDPGSQEFNLNNGKQRANLITTLAELYNFHVIGSSLMYDFIRILTSELTEDSAELLLRIVRSSGSQLRQDDPSSLSDVVALLQNSVKRVGEEKLSVRTKFMIETITDLKNNRLRAGVQTSSLRVEHVMRMKKLLGSFRLSQSILKRSMEPLRVRLDDIRNHKLRGKWWLVGASYRDAARSCAVLQVNSETADPLKHETNNDNTVRDDFTNKNTSMEPNIAVIARSMGMNTQIRQSIFIAIMTSSSIDESYVRIMKLSLKRKQLHELATVITRCVAAEQHYNPYYSVIVQKLSGHREIRKSLWGPLTEILSRLEDSESEDEEDDGHWLSGAQARFNIAKFFGGLIGDGVMSLGVLKQQRILSASTEVQTFLELLLTSVFVSIGRSSRKLQDIVAAADQNASAGWINELKVFVKTAVASTDLVDPKEQLVVRWCAEEMSQVIQKLTMPN